MQTLFEMVHDITTRAPTWSRLWDQLHKLVGDQMVEVASETKDSFQFDSYEIPEITRFVTTKQLLGIESHFTYILPKTVKGTFIKLSVSKYVTFYEEHLQSVDTIKERLHELLKPEVISKLNGIDIFCKENDC